MLLRAAPPRSELATLGHLPFSFYGVSWARLCSLLILLEVADLVEEGLVEGLPAERRAQQLDVQAPLVESLRQPVCNDGLIFVKAAGALHLLLEHAGEELSRLVGLRQTDTAYKLFEKAEVLLLEALS